MIVAVAGSRSLNFDIPEGFIPESTTLIITGGARGVDRKARQYAQKHKIKLLEILPDYDLYGRSAPLKRNDIIVELASLVIVFWDGKSRGSKYVIRKCRRENRAINVYIFEKDGTVRPATLEEIKSSSVK